MQSSSESVILRHFDAWNRRDTDAIVNDFTADAVYHNMPRNPLVGHAQIRDFVETFLRPVKTVSIRHLNGASAGNLFYSEHVDDFIYNDGSVLTMPILGVFELEGDKIRAWRDYFDLATIDRQRAQGGLAGSSPVGLTSPAG